jgi:hypothetical protein
MASSIMPTPPPTEQPAGKARKARKDSRYSAEEHAVLDKFKGRYLATTTHTQRQWLLRDKVFTSMLNYWAAKEGRKPVGEEKDRRTGVRAI